MVQRGLVPVTFSYSFLFWPPGDLLGDSMHVAFAQRLPPSVHAPMPSALVILRPLSRGLCLQL